MDQVAAQASDILPYIECAKARAHFLLCNSEKHHCIVSIGNTAVSIGNTALFR
jgi:hypothetical protein